jgi:hypothetical protein
MTKMAPIAKAQTAISMSHPLGLSNRLDRPQPETEHLILAQRGRAVLSCADRSGLA